MNHRSIRYLCSMTVVPVLAALVACHASAQSAQMHLSDYVNTLRGSNSDGKYSYGNTFPAATLPFGFNFWTPITASNSHSWIYDYRSDTIEGFAASHEPSPWVGDHGAFQLMPMIDTLQVEPSLRASKFAHANELARAHYYSVTFNNGIRTELTPTDHAVVFRFTYPASQQAYLLFDTEDSVNGAVVNGDVTVDRAANSVAGYLDHRGPRLYYYAEVDKPIAGVDDRANATAAISFNSTSGQVVTVKLATSFISLEQAKLNLAREVGDKSFETIAAAAQSRWDATLGKIEIEGATASQNVTFYSNLYRAFMYPSSMWEQDERGDARYFSPYANKLATGKIYVNNGFWDTFRAAWPLYALLVPAQTGVMLDGFVNAFKDGGWTPRWSGPGYIDIMVGSHSDILFADAYLKGITNFDTAGAYQSMLKNALVYSSDGALGRKGNARSIFKRFIPVEDLIESAAWYLEDISGDFGISQLAAALGDSTYARYFHEKSLSYVNLFSPSVGFFRGRGVAGWRTPDVSFQPNEWGYEFTEGCAWHYATAAHNDPRGMANLYGGRQALSAKIDSLFTAPADFGVGSYKEVIHEMVEARDTKMGQYAHANEPIHHMLYMYNYAGTPWKTQQHVRDVLDEARGLYGPGYDGRGYLGDEDNGQMSAWYIFSALGFYPASPGHPEYAIGSPLFTKATIHLENGRQLVIDAPANSAQNRYVQSATLNGQPHSHNYLTHAQLMAGGRFTLAMGAQPSTWGSAPEDLPTSMTTTARAPIPAADRAVGGLASASDNTSAAFAFDDDSGTAWRANTKAARLQYQFADAQRFTVSQYTVTSAGDEPGRDPRSWTLLGSNDGSQWQQLDTRSGERFAFRRQTKVYSAANQTPYAQYRLDVSENAGALQLQIAELELLGDPPIDAIGAIGSPACAVGEDASHAIDGRPTTKWCSLQEHPELVIDLGGAYRVDQVVVKHAAAGGESPSWNTRDFTISLSDDAVNYRVVAAVSGNTRDASQHTFAPVSARQVKLRVDVPSQGPDHAARIYEVEVYGQPATLN